MNAQEGKSMSRFNNEPSWGLSRIARLCFNEELPQVHRADRLGIARLRVNRLIPYGRKSGPIPLDSSSVFARQYQAEVCSHLAAPMSALSRGGCVHALRGAAATGHENITPRQG